MTVVPGVRTLDSWSQKAFVPAFEVDTVAAGHQQCFGDAGAVALVGLGSHLSMRKFGQCSHRWVPAAFDVSHREPNQHMRGAMVGLHLVRVKMLLGRVFITQVGFVGPIQQIC